MRIKPTKKAKTANVMWKEEEVIMRRSEYHCPCCCTTFIGSIAINVTRFKCGCGQEIIVRKK